jgi:beta-glucosidase/6-phospho-beta-glucosidase/beta-galactosidase
MWAQVSPVDAFLVYADGEGRVNPEGVAYYSNLINYLLQKGIEY